MKIKGQLKTAKTVSGVILYTAALLGVAAKFRKDITTHAKHDEHSPCPCDKQCVGCLFEG